jgi:GT2 family glycosyltransferase
MVTVVIATRDRASALDRTLRELRALPDRPAIIVVDNDSADNTPQVAQSHAPAVSYIALRRNAGSAARNVGVARATTPFVALCDDDSWWTAGSLAAAVEHLQRAPRLALVAARVLVGDERRLEPASAIMARSPLPGGLPLPGVPVLGFVACGAVIRRDAYLAAGGFHPRFQVGGEEQLKAIDLAQRGWALRYCDDVTALHHPSPARDRTARRRCVIRNALWTAWLRRPAGSAAEATRRALLQARSDPGARRGVRDAIGGWRWTLRERRVVSHALDRQLRLLDAEPT